MSSVSQEIERIGVFLDSDVVRAEADTAALIARNPNSFDAHMFHGFVKLRMRRRDEAMESLKQAHRLNPENGKLHIRMGFCLMRQNRLELALRAYHKACGLVQTENLYHAPMMMAICLHRLGRREQAANILQGLAHRYPRNVLIRYSFMRVLRELGEHLPADEQAAAISKELRMSPTAAGRLYRFLQSTDHADWERIDNKASLKRLIDAYRERHGAHTFAAFPSSFVLPREQAALEAAHEAAPSVWIVKPDNFFGGNGIHLIDNPSDAPAGEGWLAQRYRDNPLLIHGRKSGFRASVLIASYNPLRAYLFRGVAARLAMEEYRRTPDDLNRMTMHIDHQLPFLEGHEALLAETREVTGCPFNVLQFPEVCAEMERGGYHFDDLWPAVKAIAVEVVRLMRDAGVLDVQSAPNCRFGYYPKVLALDLFVDDTLKPWLLEVERIPALMRLFDGALPRGEGEENLAVRPLMEMLNTPYLDLTDPGGAEKLSDEAYCRARAEKRESEHRGRFERLDLEG